MRLKRLTVQGFKSFRDRTTILFSDGITGIVGPNGCGKSNIVDALFWVMGEQSAKHLRGDAMRDLIFSGSSKRAPAAWAEATLVLDNEEGRHIHIGPKIARPTEIALTRKLYRNGETEYRINNETARLRDIQEVFMGTGTGAKSYSIIAQGEIEKLIRAKPAERRSVIEEVAGVTKFKQRRKESLRKIEQTGANLTRLRDLREGVEKGLKQLEKQAQRAKRARELRENIRGHELVVNSHKVFDILKGYGEDKASVEEKTASLLAWGREKVQLDNSLKGEREEREQKGRLMRELQDEHANASKKLASIETRLALLSRQREEKGRELAGRRRETEALLADTDERTEALGLLEEKRGALTADEGGVRELEQARARMRTTEEELLGRSEELEGTKNALDGMVDLKASKQREAFGLSSTLEGQAASLGELDGELEETVDLIGQSQEENRRGQDELARSGSTVRRLAGQRQGDGERLDALVTDADKTEHSLLEARRLLGDKRLKLGNLVAANPSLEGAKAFLEGKPEGSFAILGALIEEIPERYAGGVGALLANLADGIVGGGAPPEDYGERGTDREIGFIAPDTEAAEATEVPEGFVPLIQAIGVRKGHRESLGSLLAGFYLADGPERLRPGDWTAGNFRAAANFEGTRMVRREGGALVYSFLPSKRPEGWIEKSRLLEELTSSIDRLSRTADTLESSLASRREEIARLRKTHRETGEQLARAERDYAAEKAVSDMRERTLREREDRRVVLEKKREALTEARRQLLSRQDDVLVALEKLGREEESLQGHYEGLLEDEEALQNRYREENEDYQRQKAAAGAYQERLESLDGRIGDIKLQIARDEERVALNQKRIATYEEEIADAASELEELGRDAKETSTEIERRDLFIERVSEELDDLAARTEQREERIKELYADIGRYEKELVDLKNRMDNAVSEEERYTQDTFEKYRVDLRDCLAPLLELSEEDLGDFADLSSMYVMETEDGPRPTPKEPFEFTRKYGKALAEIETKLKRYRSEYSRIGDINWQAIDDYGRQKHRWDFLKAQEEELEHSLEDLHKAIVHIDEKSRSRFKTAFRRSERPL